MRSLGFLVLFGIMVMNYFCDKKNVNTGLKQDVWYLSATPLLNDIGAIHIKEDTLFYSLNDFDKKYNRFTWISDSIFSFPQGSKTIFVQTKKLSDNKYIGVFNYSMDYLITSKTEWDDLRKNNKVVYFTNEKYIENPSELDNVLVNGVNIHNKLVPATGRYKVNGYYYIWFDWTGSQVSFKMGTKYEPKIINVASSESRLLTSNGDLFDSFKYNPTLLALEAYSGTTKFLLDQLDGSGRLFELSEIMELNK